VIFHFQDDAANTQTQTALMMLTGGGDLGGIHGKHMGSGIEIHYAAKDPKRQSIPWVEYRNRTTGEDHSFFADGASAASVASLPRFQMQCVDCHNRPTHGFELPERAIDQAMGLGRMSTTLPFIRKKAVELLKANYDSNEEASRTIPQALLRFYQQLDPVVAAHRSNEISKAASEIVAIYNRNVFPDLRVTWGTYPNNLGHTDFPGCFRCHDGSHSTSDQNLSITQDCSACHEPLAIEETSPGVLKTLGLAGRIASLQKR
jgi:hypothetical protein